MTTRTTHTLRELRALHAASMAHGFMREPTERWLANALAGMWMHRGDGATLEEWIALHEAFVSRFGADIRRVTEMARAEVRGLFDAEMSLIDHGEIAG